MKQKWLSVIVLALILLLSFGSLAGAQSKTLYWQRYDVDITVLQNGDLRVVETQELVFTNGSFTYGQRAIPLYRLDNISDVTVGEQDGTEYVYSEMDAPYTFRTFQEGNDLKVRYNFPASSDSRRTIVIGYTVSGALRYYPENGVDQLDWKAIPAGNPFPTQTSTITLHAPEPATFTNYGLYGAEGEAAFQTGQRDATIVIRNRIEAGQEVEVVAEWQHGIVTGQPSAWQDQLDAEAAARAEKEAFQAKWGPVFTLGFGAVGGLLAIGGPVLLYLWWHRKGRDHPVGLIADYLPEPPSDLPAGMVGTLIDEKADLQDILASILDLARRGFIEIQEKQEPGFMGIGSSSDFVYRKKKDSSGLLRPYEQTLINKMFGQKREVELSDLKNKFYAELPTLRKELYAAVVAEGFFKESPDATRTRYGCLGTAALVAAFALMFVMVAALAQFSNAVFCVPLGAGVIAIGIIVLARYMPQRTEQGSEAYARWNAFKRYLQNLEKYTKVEEAAASFDRYLPYAVAFGLEDSFLKKFQSVEAPAPTWWIPYDTGRPYYGGGRRDTGAGPISSPGGRTPGHAAPMEGGSSRPSLEGMSRGMGSSLAGMSAGLGSMLSQTARTLTSTPAPSGGSGGSFGGGGGFGGGGFSGGGGGGGGGSGGGGSSFG